MLIQLESTTPKKCIMRQTK